MSQRESMEVKFTGFGKGLTLTWKGCAGEENETFFSVYAFSAQCLCREHSDSQEVCNEGNGPCGLEHHVMATAWFICPCCRWTRDGAQMVSLLRRNFL